MAPTTSPYTYTAENWQVHTVHPPREFSYRKDDDRVYPTRPPRMKGNSVIGPRTAAEKAAEADLELWASCDSVEVYEAQKQSLEEAIQVNEGPTFHGFPQLPAELRRMVWEFTMAEPTRIGITCSGYEAPRLGSVFAGPARIYAATAFMPPLMLVNRETYALASRHYSRAFVGVNGGGGVLAAYPSILTINTFLLNLLREESLDMLSEVILLTGLRFYFDQRFSEQLRRLLKPNSIRRLELRRKRPIFHQKAREFQDCFESLFAELKAANPAWVAPEVSVGPIEEAVI